MSVVGQSSHRRRSHSPASSRQACLCVRTGHRWEIGKHATGAWRAGREGQGTRDKLPPAMPPSSAPQHGVGTVGQVGAPGWGHYSHGPLTSQSHSPVPPGAGSQGTWCPGVPLPLTTQGHAVPGGLQVGPASCFCNPASQPPVSRYQRW